MDNKKKKQDFLGFDESSIKGSLLTSLKYKNFLDAFERNMKTYVRTATAELSEMDFKGIVMDNDSGYISQNVESNSSVETTSDNRQVMVMETTSTVKSVYVNEDTLFEKPQIASEQNFDDDSEVEEYEEFGHLFYMTDTSEPILDSSVVSQDTNFSGFVGDESGISDISGTIPVATPIIISSNLLNIESNSKEDVNTSIIDKNCSRKNVSDRFLPCAEDNSEECSDDSKENNLNYLNVKSNLKLISQVNQEESLCNNGLSYSLEEYGNNLSSIQTRMMDANTCDGMSLFESFYSHLCGLYTRNDFPAEDITKLAINPNNLQISNQLQERVSTRSPYKNSYFQLETKTQQPLVPFDSQNAKVNSTISSFELKQTQSIVENNEELKSNLANTQNNVTASAAKNNPNQCNFEDGRSALENNSYRRNNQSSNVNSQNKSTPTGSKNNPCKVKNVQNKYSVVAAVKSRGTPAKQYKNPVNAELSPELFSDEETFETLSQSFSQIQKTCEKIYITKNDRKLLKRAQESLGGVPPPPSVTIIQMSIEEMLQKIENNRHLFINSSGNNLSKNVNINSDVNNSLNNTQREGISTNSLCDNKEQLNTAISSRNSLLVTCQKGDVISRNFPCIMQYRYHGLHHNRSKISEDFEHLCVKYAERYVGAETQSSCTVFGMDILSPSKRRYKLKRPNKSPGKRLSHLARRRITFSKDSLQSGMGSSNCSFIGARTRQIMIDARKFDMLSKRKSPKNKKSPRKTPGKSPKKKTQTPSSSSKKRFAMRLRMYSNEESVDSVASTSSSRASVTKRALFQSPPDIGETSNGLLQLFTSDTSNSESSQSTRRRTPRRALFPSPMKASPSKMTISSLYPAKRKITPKRALFMSPEKSPTKRNENCDKKRKRTDMEDEQPHKFSRNSLLGLKDSLNESKLKVTTRSQSANGSSGSQSQDIAELRKKKLMWAVSEGLRSQNIDMKHPQFKVFASVLARVIRHFLPNLFTSSSRPEGSTSESMLRIARQHVFAVTRGKTVNQIVREAEHKVRISKPSGYVGLDKIEKPAEVQVRHRERNNKENVLQDRVNTIGSDHSLTSESSRASKSGRGENVERIRRVINFGEDNESNNSGIR